MRTEVISLKRSIEEDEQKEILFHKALDSYLFALDMIWRHNRELPGALPQSRLPELRHLLQIEPTVGALDESRVELELALRRLMEANHWQEGEIREILKALAHATASLTDRNTHYSNNLRELAAELEALASSDDLLLLRVELQARVSQFRQCIEQMHAEQAGGLQKMVLEMEEFRERLHRVEEQSTIDALTGLQNRQSAEAKMNEYIDANRTFSIILLDLNRFKSINDRFGHLAGDATLREFGSRIRGALRVRDFASRWGGDEFLVMVEAPLPEAICVSRRLSQVIAGRYNITVGDSVLKVDVAASIGVAERRPGELIEHLFERADACLYEAKGPR